MVPQPTYLYHITHFDNLRAMIADGGLRTCGELRRTRTGYKDIAYSTLQDRRAQTLVPCGAKGTLHDYVPFYFAPRSPMLYAISRGIVPGYTEGQRPVVYLVTTAQAIQQAGLSFVFTDGHGIMQFSSFYDDLTQLHQVDWQIMRERMWRDTVADPDRKRRRQAEFLVHQFVPWSLISSIAVMGKMMKAEVDAVLHNVNYAPAVSIRNDWYYSHSGS
jgi:ssDNA thymidine ADP-ribosyltransferase, DarT